MPREMEKRRTAQIEVDSDGNEIGYPKWRRHLLPNYDSDGNEMPGQWGYYYDSDHSDNEQDDE